MSVISIKTAIENKLNDFQTLQGVYDFETSNPSGYPFAVVTASTGETDWGDSSGSGSARNINRHTFLVRVYQEREEELFGPEKAERVSTEILHEVLQAFQMDTTLSGACLWQRPESYSTGYELRENLVRTLEINITAVEIVDSK